MNKNKRNLLLIISIASLLMIVRNFYSIKIQSAVRAYINCQAEYSKGQNNASFYLITYLQTEDTSYITAFKTAVAIPEGDNAAGSNLLINGNDEITTKGFLAGKNRPADIRDMIWFYKVFSSFTFAQRAIILLTQAKPIIARMETLNVIFQQMARDGRLTAEVKNQYIKEIAANSIQSSEWEADFSRVLNTTASNIKIVLQIVNIVVIILIMAITFLFVMKIINNLSAADKELRSTITTLNNTNQELENFSYVASHDLKEPLRMVSSFLALIEKKYTDQLDETGRTYIHFAVDGAARMKKLIDDLLEYSRTSMDKITYETVDLNEIINELKIDFQDVFAEPGAGLFVATLPEVKANKVQMQQLLQNLIGNAVKYRSEAAPRIYITEKSNADSWIFAVKDNGQGIDAEYFKTIFIIFQRLKTNRQQAGTGIGLAICKKIAERHGGEIWVEAEPGKGSTFFFSISKQL